MNYINGDSYSETKAEKFFEIHLFENTSDDLQN